MRFGFKYLMAFLEVLDCLIVVGLVKGSHSVKTACRAALIKDFELPYL